MQGARDKDDKEVALSKYAGQVTIVVNVASQCGYTQQNYKGLVDLYKEFHHKGFEVVRDMRHIVLRLAATSINRPESTLQL